MNNQARLRRAKKSNMHLKKLGGPKIIVYRSSKNIYAQVVENGVVIASSSTLDKTLRDKVQGKKIDQSHHIGKFLAERAIEKGVKKVAFDRSGYKYHGRIKAIAEGAREGGLEF